MRLFSARLLPLLVGSAIAALAPSAASATDFSITSIGMDTSVGYRAGRLYNSGLGGSAGYADANVGRLKLDGTSGTPATSVSLLTFCVDIFDPLRTGNFFTSGTGLTQMYGATRVSTLEKFVTNAYSLVTNADTSAALQLGIWEILNETSSRYELSHTSADRGSFSVGNLSSDSLGNSVSIADGWLGNLSGVGNAAPLWNAPKAGVSLVMLDDTGRTNQEQIFVRLQSSSGAVPEPATWLTMVLGFGGMGYVMRHRRRDGAIA